MRCGGGAAACTCLVLEATLRLVDDPPSRNLGSVEARIPLRLVDDPPALLVLFLRHAGLAFSESIAAVSGEW